MIFNPKDIHRKSEKMGSFNKTIRRREDGSAKWDIADLPVTGKRFDSANEKEHSTRKSPAISHMIGEYAGGFRAIAHIWHRRIGLQ
jgi:hypothetical protein